MYYKTGKKEILKGLILDKISYNSEDEKFYVKLSNDHLHSDEVEEVPEEDFYTLFPMLKDENLPVVIPIDTNALASEVSQLWFNNMVLEGQLTQEIAQIWYEIMKAGEPDVV